MKNDDSKVVSESRGVASIFARTPVRIAEIWKQFFFITQFTRLKGRRLVNNVFNIVLPHFLF